MLCGDQWQDRAYVDKDHGPSYEGQRVASQPGDIPVSHKGADVGELSHSLHHRSCQRQQLLVQLKPRPALQVTQASVTTSTMRLSQMKPRQIPHLHAHSW